LFFRHLAQSSLVSRTPFKMRIGSFVAAFLMVIVLILQIVSLSSGDWMYYFATEDSITFDIYWGTTTVDACADITGCTETSYSTLESDASSAQDSEHEKAYAQLRAGGALAIITDLLCLLVCIVAVALLAADGAHEVVHSRAPKIFSPKVVSMTPFICLVPVVLQVLACIWYGALFPYGTFNKDYNGFDHTIGNGIGVLIAGIFLSLIAFAMAFVLNRALAGKVNMKFPGSSGTTTTVVTTTPPPAQQGQPTTVVVAQPM